ncbi:hypothetical protein [Alicyclobacillus ferrooxydans]|uniref:Uncharacterized protein n=1 Tax=Alicyclobacillus ferrooxydans TaxID=471514 RepID=A0A0P9CKJ7_9BACL|nr:hypothetical protein [Alicyclobacillus ferrooxydans]KPV43538.1 hypothetical protein AN477_12070 [Alicyclobacillus ferrooxydans]
MVRHWYVSEHSRKAKPLRQIYEQLRQKVDKQLWQADIQWENISAHDGIVVPKTEKHRLLNLKIQDEHLSPYSKTDMNLFQMHMLNDEVEITVFKAPHGWILMYNGVSEGPQPFGQMGYDTR